MPEPIGSLDLTALSGLVASLGEPPYRARQLAAWLYQRLAPSFEEMTDLPATFRATLADAYDIDHPQASEVLRSVDGTRRYLWRLADGALVESVGIPSGRRLTVCFSTQAGCAVGCVFCATGRGGFVRNLNVGEIVWQVTGVADDFGLRASNAVAMGQGEPFLNYDATLGALRIMNSPAGVGIGARHMTVSTCGVIPGIRRFAGEPEQFTLAVSLHSAIQKTRDALMPGTRRWPLTELRRALIAYVETTGRRPTLEYALIAGRNDSSADVTALVAFARGWLSHVNLIPVNPVADGGVERSDSVRAAEIAGALNAAGVETSVRAERGADIEAACGQLTQRHRPASA